MQARSLFIAALLYLPTLLQAQPCALVVPSGSTVTLTNGTFSYCSVDVQAGGTLVIGGSVTLDVTGPVNVDGLMTGIGNGYGSLYAPGLGPGAAPSGGGGGHGGMGGGGAGSGGVTYDSPTQPTDMGSQGGAALPGSGGAALVLRSSGGVTVNGSIAMGGSNGGVVPNPGGVTGGGGGAGGTLSIDAAWIVGGGSLSVDGGSGTATITPILGIFHGGGGGGLIRLCASNGVPFTGTHTETGGPGGMPLPSVLTGSSGSFYECPPLATATFTPTATSTVTATPTATSTPTPTPTPTPVGPTATPTVTATPTATSTPLCKGKLKVYPSLFHPPQTVSVDISYCQTGKYVLKVFNSAGEQVRNLYSQNLSAPGSATVLWDGRNQKGDPCASGVYILRLVGPLDVKTARVMLVR